LGIPDSHEGIGAAETYASWGWSVVPVKHDKTPAVRWKLRQTERATPQELSGWFSRIRDLGGVGIVLGAVSGHLWVRDFDDAEAYRVWAEAYPQVAATQPTVKTGRGFHVYGRWSGATTVVVHGGELRAEGTYVVAPPSPHPSGIVYEWMTPVRDGMVPEANPAVLGLCPSCNRENGAKRETQRRERMERTEGIQAARETEAIVGGGFVGFADKIEDAIARTLPRQFGSRNAQLFKLARALKGIPPVGEVSEERVRELKPIVRNWYDRAVQNMFTKDFGETWGEFANAWSKVRHPEGADVLGEALAAATAAPPPAWTEGYAPAQRLLAALCRELQRRAGDADFFLGVETAGKCVSVDKATAWRWLKAFQADGMLRVITKGSQRSGKATRYRYLADDR
jgi:hypothetical protein